MPNTSADDSLASCSIDAILAMLDAAAVELVVTPHLGYHLWVRSPLRASARITVGLIQEVYRRRHQLLPYAEANTARLQALGYTFSLEQADDPEGPVA